MNPTHQYSKLEFFKGSQENIQNDIKRDHYNIMVKATYPSGNTLSGYVGQAHPLYLDLILAAPDLLEACLYVVKVMRESCPEGSIVTPGGAVDRCMKAIAKATNEKL